MEELTVIIPTYNRPQILKYTVTNLLRNLRYSNWIHFLIGNDGDEDLDFGGGFDNIEVIPGPKRGLGANLNMLLKEVETDLILQLDDDHHLVQPLDINQFAQDLLNFKSQVGWIRLFLGTEEDLNNDDPFYNFSAKMYGRYWFPMPGVDELYIPSNRPHLKHKRFHEYYGYYEEGLKLGETETDFCHQYADLHQARAGERDRPWVVIPVAAPSFDTWQHVGQSWQREGY